MKRLLRIGLGIVILAATSSMYGCDSAGGIGVGVPVGGSRWEGGGTGPGVIVMGGPVYR
jgi:hypothetical protein